MERWKLWGMAVVLAVAGCSDLPDIDPEVCGNLVVEPGEDCDGFSQFGPNTRCGAPEDELACMFVCSDDPSSPADCPEGWGCGLDGQCRRASGRVERAPGSPWRFPVIDFAIGDVDGDGNADLVGADLSNVTVRFGTATGEFPVDLDVRTRRANGPAEFADIDGDGLLDVVIPIFSGLFVMLGQTDATLLPIAYQPFELPAGVGNFVRLIPVESDVSKIETEMLAVFGDVMGFLGSADIYVPFPDGHHLSQLAGTRVPVAQLGGGPLDQRHEFALGFTGENKVWVYTSIGAELTLQPTGSPQVVNLPTTFQVRAGPLFADVDGDGDLDLAIPVANATRAAVAVAYNNGLGGLDAVASIEDVFDVLGGAPPIAAGDLDGDNKADYVSRDAVWIADFGFDNPNAPPASLQPTVFRPTDEPFTEAAIADYNGDERNDVAIATADLDGVDFFLSTGQGLFNKFHIDSDAPPFALRAGDFDGDFVGDLAFGVTGGDVGADELVVSFGESSGGPSDPISMGRLDDIEQVEPMNSVFDVETIDLITDLLVLSAELPDLDARSVAILQGSSDRRLLSPFSLQVTEGEKQGTDIPQRALVGDFAGDAFRDLVAIASPELNADGSTPDGTNTAGKFHVWLVPGDGPEASLSAGDAVFTPLSRDEDEFDFRCATWATGDLDGDGWDEIIGVDGTFRCHGRGSSPTPNTLVVSTGGEMAAPEYGLAPVEVPDFVAPHRVMIKDLDGDGDKDVLTLFRGETKSLADTAGAEAEGTGAVSFWNLDGTIDLAASASPVTILDELHLFDADAMHLNDDLIPELVILAEGAVWAAELDPETFQYRAPYVLVEQFGEGELAVGDVNGDGLDDLAWTDGPEVHVFLGVAAPPLGGEKLTNPVELEPEEEE